MQPTVVKPWAAFLFVQSVYPAEYSSMTGVDMLLSKSAQKTGKARRFLETMPEMAAFFSNLPERHPRPHLENLRRTKKPFQNKLMKCTRLYEVGNFEGFAGIQQKYDRGHPEKIP